MIALPEVRRARDVAASQLKNKSKTTRWVRASAGHARFRKYNRDAVPTPTDFSSWLTIIANSSIFRHITLIRFSEHSVLSTPGKSHFVTQSFTDHPGQILVTMVYWCTMPVKRALYSSSGGQAALFVRLSIEVLPHTSDQLLFF